jgi:hypothetical protein
MICWLVANGWWFFVHLKDVRPSYSRVSTELDKGGREEVGVVRAESRQDDKEEKRRRGGQFKRQRRVQGAGKGTFEGTGERGCQGGQGKVLQEAGEVVGKAECTACCLGWCGGWRGAVC